ncbi:MAG: alpha-ribazole phosphatase [Boseongicola sp.]|nr:MAG: alpha-ribazole phosphatase [Boseongicola sp.]
MALIFLRHTEPTGASGLCYGRTDLPLIDTYHADFTHLANTLPPIERIVSSPLSRCHLLAASIANTRNIPLTTNPDLIEMDFGKWEGVPWNDLPRHELDQWADDFNNARPHGGESVAQLATRVRRALDNTTAEPTLWVSHMGVYRAAAWHLGHDDPWNAKLDFGTFRELA